MTQLKYWMLATLFLILIGCGGNGKNETGAVQVIELAKATSCGDIKIDEFVDSLQIIPLETTEKSLIPGYFDIWRGEKYILILGSEVILQFSIDGRFIRELARRGRAPGEYEARAGYTVDEKGNVLYISDWSNNLSKYNMTTGEFLGRITWKYGTITQALFLGNDRLAYIPHTSLKDTIRYQVCQTTSDGKWVSGLKAIARLGKDRCGETYLNQVDQELHFMDDTDTLYIVQDSIKIPLLFLSVPNRYTFEKAAGNIPVINIETTNLLLMKIYEQQIKDSPQGRNIILREGEKYIVHKKEGQVREINSIYTDLLGEKIFINSLYQTGNYINGSLSVSDLIRLKEKLKQSNQYSSEKLQQILPLLENIQEDDNPFLITGKIGEK